MAGLVKAVTKELQPEVPIKILAVDYYSTLSSKALMWNKLSSDTLLQTRNCV